MVSVQMCACAYVEARGGGHTLPSYFKTWSLCAAEASVFLAGLAASKPHWSLSVEEEACTGPRPPCLGPEIRDKNLNCCPSFQPQISFLLLTTHEP